MPHPSWDILDEFIDLGDFAVKAVIQFQAGGTRTIKGIYDGQYVEGKLDDYEQDTMHPKFTCVEGTCAGVKRGDGITIYQADGVTVFGTFGILTYPQPNGTGLEALELAQDT